MLLKALAFISQFKGNNVCKDVYNWAHKQPEQSPDNTEQHIHDTYINI